MATRILVLEDDPEMRELLGAALEDEGYEVALASRGVEALELVRAQSFDLLVADVRMEGMSGLDVIETVRAEQPTVGSLVVTGYTSEADSIRAVRLRVGDYIRKPLNLRDFLASVENLVALRHAELERLERERGLRQSALWAGRAMASFLDSSSAPGRPVPGVTWVGQTASRLGLFLGLSESEGEELELTALLEQLSRIPGAPALPPGLPIIERLLAEARQPWTANPSPAARIVACVLGVAEHFSEDTSSYAVELTQADPGRYDPAIVQALDELLALGDLPLVPRDDRRQRGLVALASTLEAAGDVRGAEHAYREALAVTTEGREASLCWLGLGRLARAAADVTKTRELLKNAIDTARSLGPASAAQTELQAGLELLQAGDPAAANVLSGAARLLGETGLPGLAAQAQLSLLTLAEKASDEAVERALSVLLRPEHRAEWAASAPWLTPFLLERPRTPGGDKALQRAVLELGGPLARLLPRLSPAAGEALMTQLEGVADERTRPLLQRIAEESDPALGGRAQRLLSRLGAPTALPVVRVFSLGGLEVYRGEERVDEAEWKTKKVKFLLAYLAAHGSRFVGEDQLVDLFWPDDAEKGRKNLYSATSILRKVLRPTYWQGDLDLVPRSQQRLQLHPDAVFWHDLTLVEGLLADIRRLEAAGEQEQALERARRVAQLYRGPYLEGCYMDWALAIRTRLEQEVPAVLFSLSRHLWSQQRYHEVLEFGRRILEIDPCHQDAHLLLIHYYLAVNRPEEAVRQYEACKRVLRTELGMEPSTEILHAHQRALLSLSALTPEAAGPAGR